METTPNKRGFFIEDTTAEIDSRAPILNPARQEVGAFHPGIITNRYYGPYGANSTSDDTALTVGFVQGTIFVCPHRTTFTRIGMNVTTADATGNLRLGIYDFRDGVAGSLVAESGSLSIASTGDAEDTISATLEAGTYLLCAQTDSASGRFRFAALSGQLSLLGQLNSGTAMPTPLTFRAHTFGAFPATFGAMSFLETFGVPYIWLRRV